MNKEHLNIFKKAKLLFLGKARNLRESEVFHKLSMSALLAWVGFGLDGISSSCYGPQEAFLALQNHHFLSLFLALMTVVTVFIISASYMQIIELFPGGGGGYLVASKLLGPKAGMVSGCALIVDYVLTITVSVTAGAEAVLSFLPPVYALEYKVPICIAILLLMTIINLRGVKESVLPLVPIFIIFLFTHVALILYSVGTHVGDFTDIASKSVSDFKSTASELGIFGLLFFLLHAYSVGSGTYTGIEAVSNGTPLIKEPRIENGKKTTLYMAFSLAFMAGGLILCYLFYQVSHVEGKTLNAVLLEKVVAGWPGGEAIIYITLISEALILLVGAQTGFLGGPRVIANMALDRWLPFRYAFLSDRLVTQNGVLTMGIGAIAILLITDGSIGTLVILYSINVFITFTLSQLGLIKHWLNQRGKEKIFKKLAISGVGFVLTAFILVTVIITKFTDGGWKTIIITSSLVCIAYMINRYYKNTSKTLGHLNNLAQVVLAEDALNKTAPPLIPPSPVPNKGTAIVLVSGFHGVSLHTLFSVLKTFPGYFKNFIFVQVGIVDAGAFKGAEELTNLKKNVEADLKKYVDYMHKHGYYAESHYSLGTDVVDEVEKIAERLVKRFPNSILFAGQLLFPYDTNFTKFLHNYAAFAIQKRLYYHGMPVLIMPIRVPAKAR